MGVTAAQKQKYNDDGFVLIRDTLPSAALDTFEDQFLAVVEEWSERRFDSMQSEDFAKFLLENRELERKLYDGVRQFPWLADLCGSPEIIGPVADLLGEPIGMMSKMPFRIDLPGLVRELAVWHQDYRYVLGNTEIITCWLPLQDTNFERGCLMVMPQSHKLGPLDHDRQILGKRHFPSNIFDREVRYVEMRRGDILLFNSLLLHSSGINLSQTVRFSVNARYSALSAPTDPSMGKVIRFES